MKAVLKSGFNDTYPGKERGIKLISDKILFKLRKTVKNAVRNRESRSSAVFPSSFHVSVFDCPGMK